MSNVDASVQLFRALSRKDELLRELEELERVIARSRAFLEGFSAGQKNSPPTGNDTTGDDGAGPSSNQ